MFTVQFSCSSGVWGFQVPIDKNIRTGGGFTLKSTIEKHCVDTLTSFLKQHNLQVLLEEVQKHTYRIHEPVTRDTRGTVYICSHGLPCSRGH